MLWYDSGGTYNSFKNEMFKIHVSLMWTVSDYCGGGKLSMWNVHIGRGYVHYNYDSEPCHLPHIKKWCFMGHRYFLDNDHRFILNKIIFNG